MKNKIIILICFTVLFSSCSSQNINTIEWNLQNETAFSIPNNDNVPLYVNHIIENNTDYTIFYNEESNQLFKYNQSNSNITDSIPIKVYPNNQIWAITYHTKDSIFIVYNASQNEGYNHTGSVIMINHKGELKKSYSLKGLPIKCKECEGVKPENLEYISMKYGNLLYYNNNLFIQMECYNYNPGDSNYNIIQHPVSASINIKDNFTTVHPITIPNKFNEYYPKRNEVIASCIDGKGNLVVGFNSTSTITKYSITTNSLKKLKLKTVFGDSIQPNADLSKLQDDYTQNSFEKLYYNEYGNYFVRVTRLSLDKNASPDDKRNPDYGLTIFNDSNDILGEGILPKGLSPICFFTKSGISFWNKEKTKISNNKTVYFNNYKIKFKPSSKTHILSQVQKRDTIKIKLGMDEYIKNNFQIPRGKFVVVFIPIAQACKSCLDNTTLFVAEKQAKSQIYILFAGESINDIEKYSNNYPIKDKSKIWFDNGSNYKKYIEPPILNGNIAFFEDGKKVNEIKIIPENAEFLKNEIKKFLNIK